jgi:bacterial/archaeal transporter family-2 protein
MSPAIVVPILLVLLAGAMIALQAPTNVMLARAGGSAVLAALISFAVGTVALLMAWVASGHRPGLEPFGALPWYAVYVAIAAYAAPRIGLASLITIGIAGQIVMALWLDHVGAMGLPRVDISPARIAGALLVVAGVVLVRKG